MKKRFERCRSKHSTKALLSTWHFGTSDEQEQIGEVLWPIIDKLFTKRFDLLFSKENADGWGTAKLILDIKRTRGRYDDLPLTYIIDLSGNARYAQYETSVRELINEELLYREGKGRAAMVEALRLIADEIEGEGDRKKHGEAV